MNDQTFVDNTNNVNINQENIDVNNLNNSNPMNEAPKFSNSQSSTPYNAINLSNFMAQNHPHISEIATNSFNTPMKNSQSEKLNTLKNSQNPPQTSFPSINKNIEQAEHPINSQTVSTNNVSEVFNTNPNNQMANNEDQAISVKSMVTTNTVLNELDTNVKSMKINEVTIIDDDVNKPLTPKAFNLNDALYENKDNKDNSNSISNDKEKEKVNDTKTDNVNNSNPKSLTNIPEAVNNNPNPTSTTTNVNSSNDMNDVVDKPADSNTENKIGTEIGDNSMTQKSDTHFQINTKSNDVDGNNINNNPIDTINNLNSELNNAHTAVVIEEPKKEPKV
jgi:hypothetical protein